MSESAERKAELGAEIIMRMPELARKQFGKQWPEKAARLREFLKWEMERTKNSNPIEVALGVAVKAWNDGVNPNFLLAAAVEMHMDETLARLAKLQ